MTEQPSVPHIPFQRDEIEVMAYVVKGYIPCLKKAAAYLKDASKLQTMQTLQGVQKKLDTHLASNNNSDTAFFLDAKELRALLEALYEFVRIIRKLTPQNATRDEILEGISALRLRIIRMVSNFDG